VEYANRTRAQLIEDLNELRSVSDNIPDYIMRYDREHRHTFANAACLRVSGKTAEEFIGKTHREFGFPEHLCRLWEDIIDKTFETAEPHQQVLEWDSAEGMMALDWRVVPECASDGSVVSVLAVSRDITEHQDVQDDQNRLSHLVDVSTASVTIHDLTGKFLYANQKPLELHGYTREEFMAINLHQLDVPESETLIEARLREIKDSGETSFEVHHVRKDGSILPLYVTVRLTSWGGETVFESIAMDITERNRAEEVMRESEKRHRAICERVSEGILAADILTKRFRYANPAMCRMLGYSEDELRQMGVLEIHPKNALAHVLSEFEAQDQGEKTMVADIPCLRKNGTVFSADISAGKMSINGIECRVGIFTDITERKQLEAQQKELQTKFARAERLESVGVLADGVAHDLNNALGPLVALPPMILEDIQGLDMEPNETIKEIKDGLSVIEGSALRSAVVVKDLLSLSRRGQYSLKPFEMNTTMCIQAKCGCQRNIRASYQNVTFTSSLSVEPLMIMADRSHLERAVGNLVHNAAESISENGRVDIRTSVVQIDAPMAGFETVPPDRYAVLEITDTGGGIPKENLPYIFEPYFTRKRNSDYSGSGLGLAVTHGVVKDHKGFIDVTSEVGKGTTFTLYLPMISVPAEIVGADSEPATKFQYSERILIVDDEKSQRFIASMNLKRLGYTASVATNGQGAVALFAATAKEHKETPFDLVLLDMTMDPDFDGLDTYQAILELYPAQKVIISSGHAESGRITAALKLGADSLPKPYNRDDLAKALRKRLDRDQF